MDIHIIDYNPSYNEFRQKVRENAYFRWLNAGKPEERDLEFWQEAYNEEMRFSWIGPSIDIPLRNSVLAP